MYYSFIVKSAFFCSLDAFVDFPEVVNSPRVLVVATTLENFRRSCTIVTKISTACEKAQEGIVLVAMMNVGRWQMG